MQSPVPKNSYSVPAAARVARIIKLLSHEPMAHRMVDIARMLEMNVSTCHNILRTLRDEGLVSYDSTRKVYGIGLPVIVSFRKLIDAGFGIYPIVPVMQDVSERLSMTAILGESTNGRDIRILTSTYPSSLMSLSMSEFDTVPILSGSMGLVVAAWGGLSDDVLRDLFQKSSHESFFSFEDFLHAANATRLRGWAVDDGTWQRGIWGISAPVPNAANKVEQILCLTCAAGAVTPEKEAEIARTLLETARRIAQGAV